LLAAGIGDDLFMTDATHEALVEQLRALEPIFHRSPPNSGREVFEAITAADFWEVGASGRVYTRDLVIDTLVDRYATPHDDPWTGHDFEARPLGGGTWLVTYGLDQSGPALRLASTGMAWSRPHLAVRVSRHRPRCSPAPGWL
jgi:hypothetical protein